MSESLLKRMRVAAQELRSIALEYEDMKFTAAEEAMTWPVVLIVDEDGDAAFWCSKEDCPLDGHNAKILDLSLYKSGSVDKDPDYLTTADLLSFVVNHIERVRERTEQ